MARYFYIKEISENDFVQATGERLDCAQMTIGCNGQAYVAVNDQTEDEIVIFLNDFEGEEKE